MHCRHFGVCGGCSLPAMSYIEQLERKRSRLADLLGVDVPPLLPSPRVAGFRSKAAFVFGTSPHGGALVMGHYAAGSNRVVAVAECPVHSGRANRIAFALRDRLASAAIRAADARGGILRHLIIRTSADESEAVAMLVVSRNDKALRSPIRALLASPDRPDGFLVNVNDRPGPLMIGAQTIAIDGRPHVRETGVAAVDNVALTFLVSPTAFFQTNVGSAGSLVRLVTTIVGAAPRVLDLYCGSGLFTLPLAAAGAAVTAVEENGQAIADLKTNVRINRLPVRSVRPVCGRAEDVLSRFEREAFDAVVLDPPREGCARRVLDAVFERLRPPRAVYVSCNPEALATELATICRAGYAVGRVQPVDMFPHTEHIEVVVEMRREGPGGGEYSACRLY